ncbi:hypothetical protein [Fulvivirga sediminis]|uniref:Uncharacterized protein n=1 Tax=Fulvivirga sediminis TaxID=2803949 RepID=A0A937K1Z6_9BACT|nr:hypothetical protein [Fulvivirga sediminis]MBL3659094.1 hypothetical protein [Fulvivirga sediminis]
MVKLIISNLFILVLLTNGNRIKAQNTRIEDDIKNIRHQYRQIALKQISGLEIDTVDFSEPIIEGEEHQGGSLELYIVYHTKADTFLISNISIQDEGGAYSKRITEAYLWDSLPFFFYVQSEGLYEGIKRELRIYISDGMVIRKLKKEARFYDPSFGFKQLSMDTIPNKSATIEREDFNRVNDFVGNSKRYISSGK